jgi:hypothetical protein
MASGAKEDKAEQRFVKRAVLVFIFIVVSAPPLGGVPLSIAFGVAKAVQANAAIDAVGEFLGALIVVSLFSYLFGAVQALVCGAWLAWVTYLRGGFSYRIALSASLLVSVLAVAVLSFEWSPRTTVEYVRLATALVFCGICSAVACRWVLGRCRVLAD